MGFIQRKCGADFRLSYRMLWKDLIGNKRHNTTHSDRYGISGHAECARPQISIRKWVLFRTMLPIQKTSTFSIKDLRKTLSQYVISRTLVAWWYKCKDFSWTDNTHWGIVRKIYLLKKCQHISQRTDSNNENLVFNFANNGDFTPCHPT